MDNYYYFSDLDGMRKLPDLPIPDYKKLNERFIEAVNDPSNKIVRTNPVNGHPIFGAYTLSESNEMVTWGILAIGEWLMNRNTEWIAPTYYDFFSEEYKIFFNSPDSSKVEYWYLFYVNMLAGAVFKTLYKDDEKAYCCMKKAAISMKEMAQNIGYDYNNQGFDFVTNQPFTNKDIYRQPDSIAGYAYQMLYASQVLGLDDCLYESASAIKRYQAFDTNPWYEIPNGSAGLFAAAWLNAHGYQNDVKKSAFWLFDNESGPLQKGIWGEESVNGLMMGWRGDTREDAKNSAYSMESLMPLQFLLPSVRYCPELAEEVSNWVRHLLSSFQLFYGQGKTKLRETRPDLSSAIPYERLQRKTEDDEPLACGDFDGHRSVYGAGYLMWLEAMVRSTDKEWVLALDLTLTDWISDHAYPVYLIQNPFDKEVTVIFSVAEIWKKKNPKLMAGEFSVWDLCSLNNIGEFSNEIMVRLLPRENKFIAVVEGELHKVGNLICGKNGEELLLIRE